MRSVSAYRRAQLATLLVAALLCFGCSAEKTEARAELSANEASPVADERGAVVFIGTSLTAGYGLPSEQAFPALIQERIDAEDLGLRVVNAGVSGDTSAGGLRRVDWLLRLPIRVFVLELGANDMLRGFAPEGMRANLEGILDAVSERHPEARFVVAGMRAAPNLGVDYARDFDAVFPALARAYNAAFHPFVLDGVAGDRSLNQADGIHPTAEGHRIIADKLWQTLAPVLRDAR